MQDNPIPGQTGDARDRGHEAAVFAQVLWLHPTHLTEGELLLSLLPEGDAVDAYERAVRDLVADGLLRIDGASIVPTLAALRSEEVSR